MADDDKDIKDKDANPNPPGLSEEKVKEMIAAGVQDALKDVQPVAPATATRDAQPDALDAVLQPRVEKIVAGPLFGALNAADRAEFYNHPDQKERELRAKHAADVEKLFDEGVKAGRTFKRDEWWSYYRGRPENFSKFVEAEVKARGEAVNAAAGEVTVGHGSPSRDASPRKDPNDMTSDELNKALEGVSF